MSRFDDLLRSPLVSSDVWASRRRILLAPLLAAVPLAMAGSAAQAGRIDPSQTVITLPDAMKWVPWTGLPSHSGEMVAVLRRPERTRTLSRAGRSPDWSVQRVHPVGAHDDLA